MSVFERFDFENFGMSEEDLLYRAIEERKYAKAYSMLRKRKEPLDGEDAARCLTAALSCTPKLFGEVLNNCEPGEYNGSIEIKFSETGYRCDITGTILMLAAAMDQTEHIQMLLERGYDVNAASLDSAQAEIRNRTFFRRSGGVQNNRYCAVKSNYISCNRSEEMFDRVWSINCCTPLAAAVACGSMDAVELLLKQPGVWSRESSAVCRAAIAVMQEEYWRQRDCIHQVFPLKDKYALFAQSEDVLDEWRFPLDAVADLCSKKQLARMLKSGLYTEADARALLPKLEQSLYFGNNKDREAELLLVARTFPKLCKEPWAKGLFLRCYLRLESKETPCTKLLNCWKRLSGKTGDLTLGLGGEDWRQPLQMSDLRRVLPALQEGGMELIMDADALHSAWSERELNFLTKYVRLVRTPGLGGLSGYAARLLLTATPKTLTTAVKRGFFRGERKQDMLEFTRTHTTNPGLRHVILSMEQEEQPPVPLPENWDKDPKWEYCKWWDPELVWEEDEEGQKWFSRLWTERRTKEDTAAQYTRYKTTVNARRFMVRGEDVLHPRWDKIEVEELIDAAVCGENPALLEVLLEENPKHLLKTMDVQIPDHLRFDRIEGTPMTVAAALGKTEQVKILLNAGYDPNEIGRGVFSILYYHADRRGRAGVAVSPVLAALLFGEEETAKLLLNEGAKLDVSEPGCFRTLMAVGNTAALELAAHLPGIGYEKLTEENLEALRCAGETREWDELEDLPL